MVYGLYIAMVTCTIRLCVELHIVCSRNFTLATRTGSSENDHANPPVRQTGRVVDNSITDDKKVPIFLHAIGATVYSTLRDLLAPANPMRVSFADISAMLKSHYEPETLVIGERFHFHREQVAEDSIAKYIAELR